MTCVLRDEVPNRLRLFTMVKDHATGANHIVESLHRVSNELFDAGTLPEVLYVQLDNSWRENKNRYVLG